MGQLINKFNYAWYGTCGDHGTDGCKPYVFADNLISLKDSVELISTFTLESPINVISGIIPIYNIKLDDIPFAVAVTVKLVNP